MSDQQPTITIRAATLADAPAIAELVNYYAARGLMLPRSLVQVYESLREFVVAVDGSGDVLGCGALRLMWHDLAEIRSLAVHEQAQGLGIGRRIVRALVAEAEQMGLARVFALTYQELFFGKLGFNRCSRDVFPQKVWADCRACPKRHCCDEIAMLLVLDEARASQAGSGEAIPLESITVAA
ncbi:MAG: N-acetyltransferase [Chloroflexota bacterium]|nr:N-acetyltransferase [Chloroflexota bacterium]